VTRHLHTTHRSSPPWFLPTLKLFSLDSSMYGTAITLSLALLLACSFNVSPLPRPADSAGAPSGVVVVVLPGVAFASVFFQRLALDPHQDGLKLANNLATREQQRMQQHASSGSTLAWGGRGVGRGRRKGARPEAYRCRRHRTGPARGRSRRAWSSRAPHRRPHWNQHLPPC